MLGWLSLTLIVTVLEGTDINKSIFLVEFLWELSRILTFVRYF